MKTLLLLVSLAFSSVSPDGPFVDLSFDEACKEAESSSKVVMIDFYTTWCGPCKKLDATTWKDPAVIDWLGEHTVPLKIDAEKERDLARRYKIDSYPTMVFLESNGDRKGAIVGYKNGKDFLAAAEDLMAGISPADRLREQLEADPKNPGLKKSLAGELRREGKYEEALELLLWCWDHGAEDPSRGFAGVRISFLIMDFQALTRVYPPARTALEERRGELETRLLEGKSNRQETKDFIALNKGLGEEGHTLEAYNTLRSRADEEQAPQGFDPLPILFPAVIPDLLKAGEFEQLLADYGDPQEWFEKNLRRTERMLRVIEDEELVRIFTIRFVKDALQLYHALLGTGSHDSEASTLVDKLLAFDSSLDTWNGLMETAGKVKRTDIQLALREKALATLPEEEHKNLKPVHGK